MASSTAPSTPEQIPSVKRLVVNRSITLPSKLSNADRTAQSVPETGAAENIEVLFVHPNASIIKFSTSSSFSGSGCPSNGARGLSWKSPTERTLAVGMLEIYRVPGSVSFLHSGTLLQAIMPRSQCWCVDGVSKFAMRVLPETYYRIELPGETKEDLELVDECKKVLGKVMFYERTACPFARDSPDELPEMEDVRYKKIRKISGKTTKWKLDRSSSWKRENGELISHRQTSDDSSEDVLEEEEEEEEEEAEEAEQENSIRGRTTPEPQKQAACHTAANPPVMKPLAPLRSITAPPQLSLRSTPPSKLRTQFGSSSIEDESNAKTFQSIPTDMPPSPPDSSAGLESREAEDVSVSHSEKVTDDQQNHMFEVDAAPQSSENETEDACARPADGTSNIHAAEPIQAVEVETIVRHDGTSLPRSLASVDLSKSQDIHPPTSDGAPQTPVKTAPPVATESLATQHESRRLDISPSEDPFAAIQARILARRSIGGTTSFYPSNGRESTFSSNSSLSSAATISSSRSRGSHRDHQQNIASALVRKACATFLGPPAHLVTMMLHIAARFANGTFGSMFLVESPVGASKRVPGSFYVGEEVDSEDELDGYEEDDFGVPLRSPVRLTAAKSLRERERRTWEVD